MAWSDSAQPCFSWTRGWSLGIFLGLIYFGILILNFEPANTSLVRPRQLHKGEQGANCPRHEEQFCQATIWGCWVPHWGQCGSHAYSIWRRLSTNILRKRANLHSNYIWFLAGSSNTYPWSLSDSVTATKSDFWDLRPFRHFIRGISRQQYKDLTESLIVLMSGQSRSLAMFYLCLLWGRNFFENILFIWFAGRSRE